ncbi:MAG TPA: GNAT family protein [Actinomycetota bacterium]|nr:GNAT family protein [Actinomycetota bacterium]
MSEGGAGQVPRLADEIVVLDAFTLEDVDVHLAGEDDEHARRFGWYPEHSTEATVRAAFAGWVEGWRGGGPARAFAVRKRNSGDLVGGCEIRTGEGRAAEVSYWTFPQYRRRGYASHALVLLSDFAFRQLGVDRIEAQVEPDNEASRRVVESVGFIEERTITEADHTVSGDPRDMILYSLTR